MRKKLWKKIAAVALSLTVCLMSPASVVARTIAEIEAEQAELESEKAALNEKLDALRANADEKREYQKALQQKIDLLQSQIDKARSDIDELNAQITALTLKLEKSQEQVQETIDQFKERLVALYTAGNITTLEILLDSRSFSDFTMRSEMLSSMTEHDHQLMDILEKYMEETEEDRNACEEDKKKVAQLKKQLEADQNELTELYAENAAALAELESAVDATEDAIRANEEQGAANVAEMEELIAEQKRREEAAAAAANGGSNQHWNISYGGGGGVEGFNPQWPMPGVYYISCMYGGYAGHRGLDIAGAYGTPIVAAESGVVIRANNYDSWGDSWGYYVLIYHNDTFTTRYAHLSSVAVYDGQYVEAGTVVGYEGATGNVTGPHLHFEVYQNGTRVDPMMFL